jgi:uncharacterized membrane protein YobD (UPF0266 family)
MIIVNNFDIFIDRNTVKKLYFKLFIASLMKNTVINQNSIPEMDLDAKLIFHLIYIFQILIKKTMVRERGMKSS